MKSNKIEMLFQQYNEGVISQKMYEFLKYRVVNDKTKSERIAELFSQYKAGYLTLNEYENLKYGIINNIVGYNALNKPFQESKDVTKESLQFEPTNNESRFFKINGLVLSGAIILILFSFIGYNTYKKHKVQESGNYNTTVEKKNMVPEIKDPKSEMLILIHNDSIKRAKALDDFNHTKFDNLNEENEARRNLPVCEIATILNERQIANYITSRTYEGTGPEKSNEILKFTFGLDENTLNIQTTSYDGQVEETQYIFKVSGCLIILTPKNSNNDKEEKYLELYADNTIRWVPKNEYRAAIYYPSDNTPYDDSTDGDI